MAYILLIHPEPSLATITTPLKKLLIGTTMTINENNSIDISTLLPRMAHEFRTPLNAINGYAQLALNAKDQNESRDCLQEILKGSRVLSDVIDDFIMLFSEQNINNGFDLKPYVLIDIISQAHSLIQPQAKEKGIGISIQTMNEYLVSCDASRLCRVLINLLSNSVKYNKVNGKINVSANKIENNKLNITIEDTGIGIPDTEINKIFDPFHRAKNALHEHGSGLGLYTCKLILKRMQGDIQVTSILNHGTKFTLTLNSA